MARVRRPSLALIRTESRRSVSASIRIRCAAACARSAAVRAPSGARKTNTVRFCTTSEAVSAERVEGATPAAWALVRCPAMVVAARKGNSRRARGTRRTIQCPTTTIMRRVYPARAYFASRDRACRNHSLRVRLNEPRHESSTPRATTSSSDVGRLFSRVGSSWSAHRASLPSPIACLSR